MILDALLASAIFAAVVCVFTIPWMVTPQAGEEH
jgi:hypothetical protein